MESLIDKTQTKNILMKKLMSICPECGKLIFGRDIDITRLEKKSKSWPKQYNHLHTHNNVPEHELTLFIDANFSVRATKVSRN